MNIQHRTFNIEHPMKTNEKPNINYSTFDYSMLNVGCSMLNVHLFIVHYSMLDVERSIF